jgi:membrane-bound lytic murein transglycosylase D
MLRVLVFILLGWVSSFAYSLSHTYPNYSYVFDEFDVLDSYIYDDDFVSFVAKRQKDLKSFYRHSLRRGKDVLPTMKGLLAQDGVSDLFIYLSMVESGFVSHALSSKKAMGLWQFMPATARQYKLAVSKEYDERLDTVSSTSAAINYLNKLHRQFGKWYLAAMAYNCGEGCVERAIKKAGTDDLSVLTDGQLRYLPRETRDYIKKILLVAMIGESSSVYSVDDSSQSDELMQVEVAGGTVLSDIAKLIKVKKKKLLNMNKVFKRGIVPTKKARYMINIPLEKMYAFYLRYDPRITNEKVCSNLVSHYVAIGETLESIAKKYKTSKENIIVNNNLDSDFLSLEQFLVIPVSKIIFDKVQK